MAPRPKDSGTVLYATPRTPVHAIVIGSLFGLFTLGPLVVFIAILVTKPTLGGLLLSGGITLGVALVGVFVTKVAHIGFVVTTEGLTIINNLRTHHFDWSEVAMIDSSASAWYMGSTQVHPKQGEMVRAGFTGVRFGLFRGEPVPTHLPPPYVTQPTLSARDAHQRFLRGEFTGRR